MQGPDEVCDGFGSGKIREDVRGDLAHNEVLVVDEHVSDRGDVIAPAATAQVKVDERLPSYAPVTGVSGSIKTVGSDTMNNLMTLW